MEVRGALPRVFALIKNRQKLRQGHERNHPGQGADVDDYVIIRPQLLRFGYGRLRILAGRTTSAIGPHVDRKARQRAGRCEQLLKLRRIVRNASAAAPRLFADRCHSRAATDRAFRNRHSRRVPAKRTQPVNRSPAPR